VKVRQNEVIHIQRVLFFIILTENDFLVRIRGGIFAQNCKKSQTTPLKLGGNDKKYEFKKKRTTRNQ
jgi:hypothetical protein